MELRLLHHQTLTILDLDVDVALLHHLLVKFINIKKIIMNTVIH